MHCERLEGRTSDHPCIGLLSPALAYDAPILGALSLSQLTGKSSSAAYAALDDNPTKNEVLHLQISRANCLRADTSSRLKKFWPNRYIVFTSFTD